MTRIHSAAIQTLAALMRSQVQALARPVVTASPAGVARGKEKEKTAKRSKSEDLAFRLARRVHAIDPADPDAERQAMHVFLESVLLGEFGEHLINDPAFHQIVEGVYQQMMGNDELRATMATAASAMLKT